MFTVCFAQVLTPRGIAKAQNECYCKLQERDLCDGSLAAQS